MADTITRSPPPVVRALVGTAGLTAALLAMDGLRMFANAPLTERWLQVETHLYYALLTLLLPCAFLVYPLTRAWWRWLVDVPLALAAAGAGGFLFVHAVAILDNGWEFGAPLYMVVVASLTWALVLEALRRAGGITLTLIAALFSLYPLIADHMPDPLSGLSASFGEVAAYHVLSTESLLGIPFRAFANLVIGFLVFGVALQHTGGGRFFIDLAFALLGAVRGGAAKVAILASGLMGSMSGSVITNVLTTGQLTIPAMRRAGLRPEYAAGVEACASTGGVLLPPVMGSTAFVMAAILEMPYYQVALAATIPALLYFTGLFIQIDLHAAREGLEAEDADALPQLGATLAGGWHYLGVFALLVVLLVYLQREAQAPWMATGVLLVLNQLRSADRWDLRATGNFLYAGAALLVEIMVVLAGVGLIVGALSLTGLSGTLVNELLFLAGGSTLMLLIIGAATSFLLGIGMTVTAAYIFLAVVLAPALVEGGLPPLGVHLFILYWAMLSFITPPVALGAFAAASIAGARPMRTGFTAMRLGGVIYLIPFLFVWNPAFLLDAPWWRVGLATGVCLAGIWLIAMGLQGWVPRLGAVGMLARVAAGIAGTVIAMLSTQL